MKKWLLLLPIIAFAQNMTVSVSLKSLELKKLAEKNGDEIYLAVTEYTKEKNTYHTIPELPLIWHSSNINTISNHKITEYTLSDGGSAQVVLSLVERDAPPWNNDDVLGTVKLTLKNNDGILQQSWIGPHKENVLLQNQNEHQEMTFTLDGNTAVYAATFSLDIK